MKNVFDFIGLHAVDELLSRLPVFRTRLGAWRSSLSAVEKKIFADKAGDLLIELEYEKDGRWVR